MCAFRSMFKDMIECQVLLSISSSPDIAPLPDTSNTTTQPPLPQNFPGIARGTGPCDSSRVLHMGLMARTNSEALTCASLRSTTVLKHEVSQATSRSIQNLQPEPPKRHDTMINTARLRRAKRPGKEGGRISSQQCHRIHATGPWAVWNQNFGSFRIIGFGDMWFGCMAAGLLKMEISRKLGSGAGSTDDISFYADPKAGVDLADLTGFS